MQLFFSKIGNGPDLVILHGLYGQGENWMNIARELSTDFTVYLVDQRNHGKSPHSPNHSYDEMTSDLLEFCNNQGLKSILLLGHSMGGKTAMTFTLKYPAFVKKLVVVDISPYSYLNQENFHSIVAFHKNVLETFKTAPVEEAKSRSEIEDYFSNSIKDIGIRRFLLKNLRRSKESNFYWQLNIQSLFNNLEKIIDASPPVKMGITSEIPTLFVRGGKSPYISDDEMEAIPDVFKNAEFCTFEKAGHWLHAEQPEKFLKMIRNFLGR
jgi:esterase